MSLIAVAERRRPFLWCGLVLCLAAGSLSAAPSVGAVAGYGDVDPDAYFARAVQWSVDNNVINNDDACFFPGAPVSRGEAAVSLWRMEGRPAAAPHRFIDVGEDDISDDAVSWMAGSGITTGTSTYSFSPDAPISRGQFAAFLHRLSGSPVAPSHRFVDLTSAWMHAPVSWMVAEGITTGVSAVKFAPHATLTSAQMVTFLYRYQGEPEVTVDPSSETCCLRVSEDTDPCGLAAELDRLVEAARHWDHTVEVSISVVLHDGSAYGENATKLVPSASSVKPLWTAAAIDVAGLAKVRPFATGALLRSDNDAAGRIIDLVGGIDALNIWSREVAGLDGTNLATWHYGATRSSTTARWSRTTTGDLARFYALLHKGDLLAPDETTQLTNWLKSTSRRLAYVEGAILERLPETVSADALQKMGWLPPGGNWITHNAITGGALVDLGDGAWFAMALSSTNSAYYQRSIEWFGLAACRIYVVLADDSTHNCHRVTDRFG